MRRSGIESLFLREKPALALLAVAEMEGAYASAVAKRIDSTFPHTISVLAELEEHGLLKAHPQGRVRILELTERGKKVALALRSLREALREPEEGWDRLERLRQIAASGEGPLRLGPLRRDLEKLKASGDEELVKAAEEIERMMLSSMKS